VTAGFVEGIRHQHEQDGQSQLAGHTQHIQKPETESLGGQVDEQGGEGGQGCGNFSRHSKIIVVDMLGAQANAQEGCQQGKEGEKGNDHFKEASVVEGQPFSAQVGHGSPKNADSGKGEGDVEHQTDYGADGVRLQTATLGKVVDFRNYVDAKKGEEHGARNHPQAKGGGSGNFRYEAFRGEVGEVQQGDDRQKNHHQKGKGLGHLFHQPGAPENHISAEGEEAQTGHQRWQGNEDSHLTAEADEVG